MLTDMNKLSVQLINILKIKSFVLINKVIYLVSKNVIKILGIKTLFIFIIS